MATELTASAKVRHQPRNHYEAQVREYTLPRKVHDSGRAFWHCQHDDHAKRGEAIECARSQLARMLDQSMAYRRSDRSIGYRSV